jgi:hypothetical protein
VKNLLLFLALGVGLYGATHYVAPMGQDSNPGTIEQPFVTIQKAVDSALPGDTIIVRDGTYTPPAASGCNAGTGYMVTINKSGTASAWITLKAEHKWGAVLDAQSSCHTAIYLYPSQYWTIQDFEVKNTYWWGIGSNSATSFFTLKGNKIHDIGRRVDTSGLGMAGVFTGGAVHDVTVDGNVIYNIGRTGGLPIQPANDHAMYMHSQNTVIINNVCYQRIQGWCIQTASGFTGTIANNTFHGAQSSAIYGRPGGTAGQIVLWDFNPGVIIRNNIFYGPNASAIAISRLTGVTPATCAIDHNIVYGHGVSMTNREISDICSVGSNLLGTDPLFVNVATAPYDFHLQPGSPAIQTGAFVIKVKTDFDGWPRPDDSAFDVGAYQFTATAPPLSPPVAARDGARPFSIAGRAKFPSILIQHDPPEISPQHVSGRKRLAGRGLSMLSRFLLLLSGSLGLLSSFLLDGRAVCDYCAAYRVRGSASRAASAAP